MSEVKEKPRTTKYSRDYLDKDSMFALEQRAIDTFHAFNKDPMNELKKADLTCSIQELSFAILEIGKKWKKFNIDREAASWEYTTYLMMRVLKGEFPMIPKTKVTGQAVVNKDRFPLQKYIDINLQHIVARIANEGENDRWLSAVEDISDLVWTDTADSEKYSSNGKKTDPNYIFEILDRKNYAENLIQSLLMFYPIEEVRFKLPLAMNFLGQVVPNNKNSAHVPEDIKTFIKILVPLAKRVVRDSDVKMSVSTIFNQDQDPTEILRASVNSSIFLSTIANTDLIDRRLLMSMDIDSLYRLSHIAGGETIKIPKASDIDSVIGVVTAISDGLLSGKDPMKVISSVKKKWDLNFVVNKPLKDVVHNMVKSYMLLGEDGRTESLVGKLLVTHKGMDGMIKALTDSLKKSDSSRLVEAYSKLVSSSTQFTETLMSLSDKAQEDKKCQS
jgi:hypothetical protein